jgi:hypothetical protein
MAKIRKQRTKAATPGEVISATMGLLTPQEGQEIRSTRIKYQNLKQGSRLYDQIKDCLACLDAYHMARYKLQRANYRLQMLLDRALVDRSELSQNHHWKFKFENKQYATQDGTTQKKLVAADLYCWDTPNEDFRAKLPAYLPGEQADNLELGFLELGDINNPAKNVPGDTPEGTAEDTPEEASEVSAADMVRVAELIAALPANVTQATVQAFGREYKHLSNMPAKAYFFLKIKDEEKNYFFENALNKREQAKLKVFLGGEDFEYDKAVGE